MQVNSARLITALIGSGLLLSGCATDSTGTGASGTSPAGSPSTSTAPATTDPLAGLDPVLAGAAPVLSAPLQLAAPAEFGACPDAADALSTALGTRIVYWQGELPRAPEGCQWANLDTVTGQTIPEQRFSLNIGFFTGLDPSSLEYQLQYNSLTPCETALEPFGAPGTGFSRCTSVASDGSGGVGDTSYLYLVADASGAGLWQLSVTIGTQYPGDQQQLAADGLQAIARVAAGNYGAP